MITFFISGSFKKKNILCLHMWEKSESDYFISVISSLSCQLHFFHRLWEMSSSSLFVTGNKLLFHVSFSIRKQSWIYYSPTHKWLIVWSLGCNGAFSALSRMISMVKPLWNLCEDLNPFIYIQPRIILGQGSLPTKTSLILTGSPEWLSYSPLLHLLKVKEAGVTVNHSAADLL